MLGLQRLQRRLVPVQRASSAVHNDKENRVANNLQTYRESSFRERTGPPPLPHDNRPSTTQAFRVSRVTCGRRC